MKLTLRTVIKREEMIKGFKSIIDILTLIGKPFSSLTEQEKHLVSIIMFYNEQYKTLSKEDRRAIVFSLDVRKKMQELLNIQKGSFNNLLHSLRKKEVLNDLTLIPILDNMKIDKTNSITFNIEYDD